MYRLPYDISISGRGGNTARIPRPGDELSSKWNSTIMVMNVQIRDADALESIKTASLRRYLQSSGWSYGGCWVTWATIHVKEHRGRMRKVLTPLRENVSDYADSMSEALSVLSEVEERPQPDIFSDLQ